MENLQTRTEHSRSLADAEKYQAIQTLTELGLFIPVRDLETYHGRVGSDTDATPWVVDPTFANGGNDSGNYNLNSRPTLYTADVDDAQSFADWRKLVASNVAYRRFFEAQVEAYTPAERARWLERENTYLKRVNAEPITAEALLSRSEIEAEGRELMKKLSADEAAGIKNTVAASYTAEAHKIVTADTDAVVLDLSFDETKLDRGSREKYDKALLALAIPVMTGSPVSFGARDSARQFVNFANSLRKKYITEEDLAGLPQDDIDVRTVRQLALAYNARNLALAKPTYLADRLVRTSGDVAADTLPVGDQK